MPRKRKFDEPYVKPPKLPKRSLSSIEQYWNQSLNNIDIRAVSEGSHKKYHWIHTAECGCKHEWQTMLRSMTTGRRNTDIIGCTICTGTSKGYARPCCAKQKNALLNQPKFLLIQHEWSSKELKKPEDYYRNSQAEILWEHISPSCGCKHEWKAKICTRVCGGCGCPYCNLKSTRFQCCSKNTISENVELMKSWDTVKNNALGLFPTQFSLGSSQPVYWTCLLTCPGEVDCKHEWMASIKTRKHHGCPFHKSAHQAPCCRRKSLAADVHMDIVAQMHPIDRLNLGDLRLLYPSTKKIVRWVCKPKCGCIHEWETELYERIVASGKRSGSNCPYCTLNAPKICCAKNPRSLVNFEDKDKLAAILHSCKKRGIDAIAISLASHQKIIVDCARCSHSSSMIVSSITGQKEWCAFCCTSIRKLCSDLKCSWCFPRRLSNWTDTRKLACFVEAENGHKAYEISISGNLKVTFRCDSCNHTFTTLLYDVTKENGSWCPYCCVSSSILCSNSKCVHCFKRSLSNWDQPEKLKCYLSTNVLKPREIPLYSSKLVSFKCNKCNTIFEKRLYSVTAKNGGCWCPSCYRSGISRIACAYMDEYEKQFGVAVQHVHFTPSGHAIGSEHRLDTGKKIYRVDGFIQSTNTVVEFHGDYYHGNPRLHNQTAFFSKRQNITFGDLYARTLLKMHAIANVAKMDYVWEDEFRAWRKNRNLPFPAQHFISTGDEGKKATIGMKLVTQDEKFLSPFIKECDSNEECGKEEYEEDIARDSPWQKRPQQFTREDFY